MMKYKTTKITVKELKTILATLADDEEIELNPYVDGDDFGNVWGHATLETENRIILDAEELE